MISRWRGLWIALLLILLPAPVASQADSATVQVVRVIDVDVDTIRVCCVFGAAAGGEGGKTRTLGPLIGGIGQIRIPISG